MPTSEYQDQDVWYEVWGFGGFGWEFLADFDSREEADDWDASSEVAGMYERTKVKRVYGLAE